MQGSDTLSDSSTPASRHWLARALSWKFWLPVGILLLAATGALMYRESRLSAIPDIGDPFDVKEFCRLSVEPADNAWLDYEAAAALLVPMPPGLSDEVDATLNSKRADATPGVQKWLADNQPALQRWRAGTAKDRALRVRPEEASIEEFSGGIAEQRSLMYLALLDFQRSEADGDLTVAWDRLRSLFRYSRHIGMNDTAIQRLIGVTGHELAVARICHWANLDQVTPGQLQIALDEVRADYQMTTPLSVAVKFEYMIALDELNRVDELRESRALVAKTFGRPDIATPPRPLLFLAHEPEVTSRLLQHQAANVLQHVDEPACDQPRCVGEMMFFDSAAAPGSQVLTPAEFEFHCSQTPLASHLLRPMRIGSCIREQARQAALEVTLAAERFRREFGQLPESLSELLAREMLPETPDDPWGVPGAKLQYERDPGDPSRGRVWSVGANRVDDGGNLESREFGVGDEGFWIGEPPATA